MNHTHQSLSTNQLVQLVKLGDHQAFQMLIAPLQDKIYRRALQATGSTFDAEDIMQDTLLIAYSKIHTFRQESLFGSWVYQICTYQILMYHRKNKMKRLKESSVYEYPTLETIQENEFFIQELLSHLKTSIYQLDYSDQQVMVLWLQGFNIQQIHSQTHLSVAAIKSRLHRAKKRIKIRLQALGLLENY